MRRRALAVVVLSWVLAPAILRADEAAPAAPPIPPVAAPPAPAPVVPQEAGPTPDAPPTVPSADSAKPFRRGIRVLTDVVYAKVGDRPLSLDLYLPEAAPSKPLPLLVWVHGGGWIGGDKRPCASAAFVPTGWIVASVGYRLTTVAPFPAQIHDVKAAIRFLRRHAATWGIDPDRFAAMGASAGGHLVALLGTSGGVAELEGTLGTTGVSSAVQAVVDYCGPTDLTQFDGHGSKLVAAKPGSVIEKLLGGPLAERGEVAKAANPITFIDRGDPPFLIFHGDQDAIVPLHQSRLLATALEKSGVPVTLVVVPGAGHAIPRTEVRAGQFLRDVLVTPSTAPAAPVPEPAGMGSSR